MKEAVDSAKTKISEFYDWVLKKIPKPIKKKVNEGVEKLKKEVNKLFKQNDKFNLFERERTLKGYLKTWRIVGQKKQTPRSFFIFIQPKVKDLIDQQKKPIKIKFLFTCSFWKEIITTENLGYFHSDVEIILESTDFSSIYLIMIARLLELVDQFQNQGSGWIFKQIEYLDIAIDPFKPLSASSYFPLPKFLANKGAIINVKNEKDNECFKWAVTSAIFQKEKNPQRLTKTNEKRL